MKIKYVLIYLLCMLLVGCASYPGEQVAKVEVPSMAHYKNKPSVYVDFSFYRGKATDASPITITSARDFLSNRLDKLLKESNLFESYTLSARDRKPGDYVIKVNYYNHGSVMAAMVPAILTGASFYVIPSYATDNYTMTWTVTGPNKQVITTKQSDDYIKTHQGIWFILDSQEHTVHKAITETFDRQVNDMLKQMIDQQVFEYSNEPKK